MATIDRCARRVGVGLFAVCAAVSLPMVGVFGRTAAADTALTLFEHDTQSTEIDLGEPGHGPGDQFLFAGDVFDHPGGTNIGHVAGQCTTLSGDASSGDAFCHGTFVLEGGELAVQGLDTGGAADAGQPGAVAIVGGTGIYANARGDGTIQMSPDAPADSTFVLNVITG
ncbi:MAG: hypothetical protein QOH54_4203 [Mycobacterium sp.]|nr:hypothetical protein [Mycobacterium sp.]MDT5289241.1 hypothetical protein [Mycobacterium sp.]